MGSSALTTRQFQAATAGDGWRVLTGGACAWFTAPTHRAGADLVRAVAQQAGAHDEMLPDVDLRAGGVRVRIRPVEGALTSSLADLARSITASAETLGLRPDPAALQFLQVSVDALDREAIQPFWRTVLGYEDIGTDHLGDPGRRQPPIWFQQQDHPRPLRNRLHVDAVRAQPVSTEALAAVRAGAAGVAEHGYYATIADAEGNEVDVLPLQPGADLWTAPEAADWRLVFDAMACYPVSGPQQATGLASAVADLADGAGLPLAIDIRDQVVTIGTGKDIWEQDDGYAPLAADVQRVAREMGLAADTDRPRFVQVGIDAVDIPAVREFWQAALGYLPDPRPEVTDLIDPRGLGMPVFFQPMDASDTARRAQRNRIHLDVFVPDDQVTTRVDAAVAAGGRVVDDAGAPHWWTLADPEGNEVDIAVAVGRDEAGW